MRLHRRSFAVAMVLVASACEDRRTGPSGPSVVTPSEPDVPTVDGQYEGTIAAWLNDEPIGTYAMTLTVTQSGTQISVDGTIDSDAIVMEPASGTITADGRFTAALADDGTAACGRRTNRMMEIRFRAETAVMESSWQSEGCGDARFEATFEQGVAPERVGDVQENTERPETGNRHGLPRAGIALRGVGRDFQVQRAHLVIALAVALTTTVTPAQIIRDVDLCALPLERPMRAVHAGGNWGDNRLTVEAWEADASKPLLPPDYVAFLQDLRVNWVGVSVALHYEDSMDSTVERVYSREIRIPTFEDRALRQYIREFRERGFEVYLTLAFEAFEAEDAHRPVSRGQLGRPAVPDYGPTVRPENWPWLPDHTEHTRFVREFWRTYTDQAVYYARMAEEEGVGMYSLGTETDSLFRSRSGGAYWVNDFGNELRAMVESVRAEYGGLLTYSMHYLATIGDWFDPGLQLPLGGPRSRRGGKQRLLPVGGRAARHGHECRDAGAVVQSGIPRLPPSAGGREHRSTARLHRVRVHGYRGSAHEPWQRAAG